MVRQSAGGTLIGLMESTLLRRYSGLMTEVTKIRAQALEKEDVKHRESYLQEACGNDVDMLARGRELLSSHEGLQARWMLLHPAWG